MTRPTITQLTQWDTDLSGPLRAEVAQLIAAANDSFASASLSVHDLEGATAIAVRSRLRNNTEAVERLTTHLSSGADSLLTLEAALRRAKAQVQAELSTIGRVGGPWRLAVTDLGQLVGDHEVDRRNRGKRAYEQAKTICIQAAQSICSALDAVAKTDAQVSHDLWKPALALSS
jgi:hypothetical protein